jgi:hypothetical protein
MYEIRPNFGISREMSYFGNSKSGISAGGNMKIRIISEGARRSREAAITG